MSQKSLARALLVVLGAALLFFAFRGVDWADSWELVQRLGARALLIPLPFLVLISIDTFAWRYILRHFGSEVPFADLFKIRISSEAILLSMGGGVILSEALAPVALRHSKGIPATRTLTSLLLRKLLLILSQGGYLAIAAVALGTLFSQRPTFKAAGAGAAIFVSLFGVGLWLLFVSGAFLGAARTITRHIPFVTKKTRGRLGHGLAALQDQVSEFKRLPHPLTLCLFLLFFTTWFFESFETYLLLELLGQPATFFQVLGVEPFLSLLKHAVFFIPGGIGVLDVGYATSMQTAGLVTSKEAAAAFLMLKRAKEVLFILFGLALLPFLKRPRSKTNRSSMPAEKRFST